MGEGGSQQLTCSCGGARWRSSTQALAQDVALALRDPRHACALRMITATMVCYDANSNCILAWAESHDRPLSWRPDQDNSSGKGFVEK